MLRSWVPGHASRAACLIGVLVFALAPSARAQIDSREGIALQNQLYQLRQDLQTLRADMNRGGGFGGGGGGDAVGPLVSRVQAMEEQVRQLRGRIDEAANQTNRRYAELAKRLDDLTFQLNMRNTGTPPPMAATPMPLPPMPVPPPVREVAPQPAPEPAVMPRVENQPRIVMPMPSVVPPPPPPPPKSFTFNQEPEPMREVRQPPTPPTARIDPAPPVVRPDPTPPAPRPPREAVETPRTEPRPVPRPPVQTEPPPDPGISAAPIAQGGKRTPEMALQEGHAALARRDYAGAERAAREVMSNRASPRAYDGQFLLAQALSGQKQFAQSAIAFDDAYNRSRKGRHAQDALVGLAGSLTAINEKRAACDTLSKLRSEFPQVRADLKDSIERTNDRAGCAR